MSDLRAQLRGYYEATTEEVDVGLIPFEKDVVLVGSFPEATRRRSAVATNDDVRRRRWWRSPLGAFGAAAASLILVLSVVGLVQRLGIDREDSAGPGPAEVLEAYRLASNAGDLDAVANLFAEDAVVEGHPLWRSSTTGREQIRDLEERAIAQSATSGANTYLDITTIGNSVTFGHRWINEIGDCFSGEGHVVMVEDGKIVRWVWGTDSQPCE